MVAAGPGAIKKLQNNSFSFLVNGIGSDPAKTAKKEPKAKLTAGRPGHGHAPAKRSEYVQRRRVCIGTINAI